MSSQYTATVTSYDSLKAFVDQAVDQLGMIDVLVNNVHRTTLKPFLDLDIKDFQTELEYLCSPPGT